MAVAGKTGTAQTGGGRSPHAWFVSFAPADDPQVAVAVIVENGGGAAEISGNQVAGADREGRHAGGAEEVSAR